MPFAPVHDILKCASDNDFAVASINVFDMQSTAWVIKAAEIEKLPVIVMLYPDIPPFMPMHIVGTACRQFAELAEVPVGLHLDHSPTFEIAMSGIPAGFQSIMFDGSALPFQENMAITKRVVETAHIFNVDVEAELGYVGRDSDESELFNTEHHTKPDDAVVFVEETGVDVLAVSIGNSHGTYICEPRLDIKLLDEINRKVSVPLAIHGGSGIPDEQISEAIKHGIDKLNIGTDFFNTYMNSLGTHLLSDEKHIIRSLEGGGEEVIEAVRRMIRNLNPSGFKL